MAEYKEIIDIEFRTQMNQLRKVQDVFKKTGVNIAGISKQTKEIGKSMKGWNTLSITLPLMFGFQNAAKAMKSAIDPAMEMVGATELYQEFLAIKYLPTALEQLDNVIALGEEWGNQSEEERKAAGDLALASIRMSEFISFASQAVMTMQAFGKLLPEIDLAPFGVGLTVTGEQFGTWAGLSVAAGAAALAFGDDAHKTEVILGGFGQTAAISGMDIYGKFGGWLQSTKTTYMEPFTDKLIGMTGTAKTEGTATAEGYTGNMLAGLQSGKGNIVIELVSIYSYFKDISDRISKLPFVGYVMKVSNVIGKLGGIDIPFIGDKKDDFIWRAGQSPISINPDDTLVGSKGGVGNSVRIEGVTINMSSVAGKDSTDRIVNEIIEKLGIRMTGVSM